MPFRWAATMQFAKFWPPGVNKKTWSVWPCLSSTSPIIALIDTVSCKVKEYSTAFPEVPIFSSHWMTTESSYSCTTLATQYDTVSLDTSTNRSPGSVYFPCFRMRWTPAQFRSKVLLGMASCFELAAAKFLVLSFLDTKTLLLPNNGRSSTTTPPSSLSGNSNGPGSTPLQLCAKSTLQTKHTRTSVFAPGQGFFYSCLMLPLIMPLPINMLS